MATYESKTPFEVWGVFHIEGDGCSYSAETLVGIFLTQSDAETELLKYIEKAEVLNTKHQEFATRLRNAHRSADWVTVGEIITELSDWRKKVLGGEYNDIPDTNIGNYTIEPVEVGAFRDFNV